MCQRFLIDQMLMRLGRWLRLMGQDVANPPEGEDHKLILQAKGEGRTLITRDRELAQICKNAEVDCILIESSDLDDQLTEMEQSGIELVINPVRCTLCNGLLKLIDPEKSDEVRNLSHLDQETPIWICQNCQKLYWAGSHWKGILQRLEKIRKGQS